MLRFCKRVSASCFAFLLSTISAFPQSLLDGNEVAIEAVGTMSSGEHSPLWLSSNRYGMSSIERNWAIERVAYSRSIETDSLKELKMGYGLDVALMQNATSDWFVQQAYWDLSWKKLLVTIGAKEMPLELKNNELTSGGMSLGSNAHPIPQARIELDYFSFPGTNGWWKIKLFGSYGMTTDALWQKEFVRNGSKYTSNTLYHEKAIYLKFGKEDHPVSPLTFTIGLQMMAQFGGTSYNVIGRTLHKPTTVKHPQNLSAFWSALICSGSDATDGRDPNTAGNHLGSYNVELAWHDNDWKAKAYLERFFDDQSNLTTQYALWDCMLGAEVTLPKNPFVSSLVIEHIGTRRQTGSVYHDESTTLPDKMDGRDNYYNHNIYTGWQHWGMAIGNPLLTSPIYNKDGRITFKNNRIEAWHFGLSGNPTKDIHYRFLFSFSQNWGTYASPYPNIMYNRSYLAEVSYTPHFILGWYGKLAVAHDNSDLIGTNTGVSLSLCKRLKLSKGKKHASQ